MARHLLTCAERLRPDRRTASVSLTSSNPNYLRPFSR